MHFFLRAWKLPIGLAVVVMLCSAATLIRCWRVSSAQSAASEEGLDRQGRKSCRKRVLIIGSIVLGLLLAKGAILAAHGRLHLPILHHHDHQGWRDWQENSGNGDGDGDGYGDGDGDGDGYGDGDGDGEAYGDGDGEERQDGYGDADGYGDGENEGDAFGDADGDGEEEYRVGDGDADAGDNQQKWERNHAHAGKHEAGGELDLEVEGESEDLAQKRDERGREGSREQDGEWGIDREGDREYKGGREGEGQWNIGHEGEDEHSDEESDGNYAAAQDDESFGMEKKEKSDGEKQEAMLIKMLDKAHPVVV